MKNVDLAYAFGLPPEKAIAYFRAKGYRIAWDWHEMLGEAHAKAFTVAKVMRTDILEDIRAGLDSALASGTTLQQFKKDLIPLLQKKGWWGEIVNEQTGEVANITPRRLDTIYRTNLQTSYMAGRFRSMSDNVKNRPYWMYVAVLDGRTRPAHRALHGKVFRYDDPVWNYIYPPNGFRCRCRVTALDAADLEAKGLNVESSTGRLDFVEEPVGKLGEMVQTARYRGIDEFGKEFTFQPDPGWSYNPGAAASLSNLVESKLTRLDADLGAALFADLPAGARKAVMTNYTEWLDAALSGGLRKDYALLGSMGADEVEFLKEMGKEPQTSAIVINDRLVAGKKAARHIAAGDALTAEEWQLLPEVISNPEQKLYDNVTGKLLYVATSANDPRKIKIVVETDAYIDKLKRTVNEAVTVFKIDGNALEDRTRYQLIKQKSD